MPSTLGYHLVKSGYGLWLPGDSRGSWSEAWDAQIGFHEPHMLHEGDPVRRRMAEERMKHPPVKLTAPMLDIVAATIDRCAASSEWKVAAMSVEPTHLHLLFTFTSRNVEGICKWLGQETTKAVHEGTPHAGPVWCKGNWCSFIFDAEYWHNTIAYIEAHNVRRGLPRRPWPFILPHS